jgi:O-antigen/teichoic acid export membrane protein
VKTPATANEGGEPGPHARRTAKNVVALATAEVVSKLGTLAYTVVAAHTLSRNDFGAFALAVSYSLLVATIPTWGLGPLLVQRASAEPNRLPVLLSETVIWRLCLVVPVFLVAVTLAVLIRSSLQAALALVLVLMATMIDVLVDAGRSAAGAMQSLAVVGTALILQRLTVAALGILALVGGLGLIGLSAAYLAGAVIGAFALLRGVRRLGVRTEFRSVTRRGLRETGRLSVAVGLDEIVSMALFRVDQVILALIKGLQAVAIYAAVYRLLETGLFITWAVSRALLPALSADRETWRIRRGLEAGIAATALLFIPFGVGLWLEARPVLDLLYGPGFADDGVAIARWLSPAPLLFAIGFLGSFALLALGRRRQVLVASIFAAVYNVGLNILIIPRLSGLGAAVATTTSYALEAVIILVFLWPVTRWIRLDRAVALPTAASAVMAVTLVSIPSESLVVRISAALAVLATTWYALARWKAPGQLAVIKAVLPWRR